MSSGVGYWLCVVLLATNTDSLSGDEGVWSHWWQQGTRKRAGPALHTCDGIASLPELTDQLQVQGEQQS